MGKRGPDFQKIETIVINIHEIRRAGGYVMFAEHRDDDSAYA